jgi:hypothetical protein
MVDSRPSNKRKRILKHLGNVCMAFVSLSLITSPVSALDPVKASDQVIGSEGGTKATKAAIDIALTMAKSKPAMKTATAIVCLACIPLAGAAVSPGMCIACGILIVKTFG